MDVPFWGPHDGEPHLGIKFPKNPLKGGRGQTISQVGEKYKFKYLQN